MAKTKNLLFVLLAALFMTGSIVITGCTPAQAQIYQSAAYNKYVKSSAFDTASAQGSVNNQRRTVTVTNETSSTPVLLVYFGNSSGVRDTTGYVRVNPGKILKASFIGRKVYRKTTADSVYSQVIFGDIELGYNSEFEKENSEYQFASYKELQAESSGIIYLSDGSAVEYKIYDAEKFRRSQYSEVNFRASKFKIPLL